MSAEPAVRPSVFLRLWSFLTGADPDILQRCPPRDHSSVMTIALLLLGICLWQTIAFSLTAHMLLDEMTRIRLDLVAVAILMAGMVMLIDSYSLIRASWYLRGVEELARGGLEIPGHAALQFRNRLQLAVRLAVAVIMSLTAAVGFNLFSTSPEIDRMLVVMTTKENAPILQRATTAYDEETTREVAEIESTRRSLAKVRADASALRLDVLQGTADDPELKAALDQERRLETACNAAERQLNRTAARDAGARQAAQQRASACRAQRQAAQALVARLRARDQEKANRHRSTVQSRLDETLAAEQILQTRLEALEKAHVARLTGREDNIRAAMLRDPGYHPQDRGLLARVKALVQLMTDPWVLAMTVLLHLAFLAIELGAVLCKVLPFIPSTYAVTLASEEHAHAAETAAALWRRLGGQASADAAPAPEPTTLPDEEDEAWTPPPANDDAAPRPAETLVDQFEESAELAQAQAAKAAAEKTKAARRTAPAELETLAASVLDGPVRRGRGRPPGTRSRSKPDDEERTPADEAEVA